jgi:hypothetical protein
MRIKALGLEVLAQNNRLGSSRQAVTWPVGASVAPQQALGQAVTGGLSLQRMRASRDGLALHGTARLQYTLAEISWQKCWPPRHRSARGVPCD